MTYNMDSTSKGLKIKNGAVESPLQKKKKKKIWIPYHKAATKRCLYSIIVEEIRHFS
jgi:hypothetical protein